MILEQDVFVGEQLRLVLNPKDKDGNPVLNLDLDAVRVVAQRELGVPDPANPGQFLPAMGSGTAPQDPSDTVHRTVFRPTQVLLESTEYDVEIDGRPGSGVSIIPFTIRARRIPLDAVDAGVDFARESDSTPP